VEPLGPLVGVGFGPDLFGGFALSGDVAVRNPHNDLLEIWARTGVLGAGLWLTLVGMLALWSFNVARRFPYGRWLLALQAVSLMGALTQPFFAFAYSGMMYYLCTGMSIGFLLDDESGSMHSSGPLNSVS
jgi:O-antigen ligase